MTVLEPFICDISGLIVIPFLSLGQEKAFDKMYHDSLVGNLCPIGCFSLVLWGISPKHGMLHHSVIKLCVLMGSNIFNRETYWTSSLSY